MTDDFIVFMGPASVNALASSLVEENGNLIAPRDNFANWQAEQPFAMSEYDEYLQLLAERNRYVGDDDDTSLTMMQDPQEASAQGQARGLFPLHALLCSTFFPD